MHNNFISNVLMVIVALTLVFASQGLAQELNVHVEINSNQIENRDLNYLNNFEEEIESYLNGYNWSKDEFKTFEKVDAEIQIFLTSVSANYTFTADLVVRSTRPVYNTTRHSTLFLYNDNNWTFRYIPSRTLVHDELQYDSITTLLNFYAYLILGYDYDSFEALGGSPYFQEAREQVSIAQASSASGWQRSSMQPNNRSQLIADLTSPNYELLRKAFYQYHRHGLDVFINNPEKARQNILKALQMIEQAKQQTVNNLLFDIFFNAKYLELVSIFQDASPKIQQQAYNLLAEIDVSHLNAYRQLQ